MQQKLQLIDPGDIVQNPHNPRMNFPPDELNKLLESIREVNIQVPITVYKDGTKYTILDGERRWRCALKLNKKAIPAIIQPKPSELKNLLTMFNIHNVRQDWDLMPTAIKLGELKKLIESATGREVTKTELAKKTGVSSSQVTRCLDLLGLPKKYQELLIAEGEKPKHEQETKADLFIEIMKTQRSVERHVPEVFKRVKKQDYVARLVDKYHTGTISNVVKFRELSKVARAEDKGVPKKEIISVLVRMIKDADYTIEEAYKETAEREYQIRDLKTRAQKLIEHLEKMKNVQIPEDAKKLLKKLKSIIEKRL